MRTTMKQRIRTLHLSLMYMLAEDKKVFFTAQVGQKKKKKKKKSSTASFVCLEFYGPVNNEVMSSRSVNSGTVPEHLLSG